MPVGRTLSGYDRGDEFGGHQENTEVPKDQCCREEIKSWNLLIDLVNYASI